METLNYDDEDPGCTECGASFEFHMTHRFVAYPVVKDERVVIPLLVDYGASCVVYDIKVCYSYKMNVT